MKTYDYNSMRELEYALAYDDVLLVPAYSSVESRLHPNTNTKIAGKNLTTPIISSPMDTITGSKMACSLGDTGAAGIIHRFMSVAEQVGELKKVLDHKTYNESVVVSPAIGVGEAGVDRFKTLWREFGSDIDWIAIDIANGHSSLMIKTLSYIKEIVGSSSGIVAGNVATGDGFAALAKAGADAVRVGIGGGSICKTRIMTGFGIPTMTSVADCYREKRSNSVFNNVSIIADGGVRNPADLVKSIVAGADAVMVGRVFAATDETPGELFSSIDGKKYKIYRGMASKEVQSERRNGLKPGTCAEGVSTTLPYKGSVKNIVNEFSGGLRSAMTYANATTLKELRDNSKFVYITGSGLDESHAFGTKK